ncbi:MAG: hypothetical protein ABIO70_16275, partial [Pseudomonadota bacterium]
TDLDSGYEDVVVTVGTWGTDAELTTSVISSAEVDFTAPSASTQGSFDVVLYNGINLAYLEDGLNYVDIGTAYIWWPVPADHASGGYAVETPVGVASETLYGRIWIDGYTPSCTPTSEPTDIDVEIGYGAAGTDPRYDAWTWVAATFNSGSLLGCTPGDGQNEYTATLGPFGGAATYAYTFRYAYDGGPWIYGEYRIDYGYTGWEGSGYAPGETLDLDELGSLEVYLP